MLTVGADRMREHTLYFSRSSLDKGELIILRRSLEEAVKWAFLLLLREELTSNNGEWGNMSFPLIIFHPFIHPSIHPCIHRLLIILPLLSSTRPSIHSIQSLILLTSTELHGRVILGKKDFTRPWPATPLATLSLPPTTRYHFGHSNPHPLLLCSIYSLLPSILPPHNIVPTLVLFKVVSY